MNTPNTSAIGIAFTTRLGQTRRLSYSIYYNGTIVQEDAFTTSKPEIIVSNVQVEVDNAICSSNSNHLLTT
jgi:hypothetical protein